MPFAQCAVPRHVYRVCFGDNPLAFVPYDILQDRNREPGRWDPYDHSFRVLYTADTLEAAFKEVLADLKSCAPAMETLGQVTVDSPADSSAIDVPGAVIDYLQVRSAGVLIVGADTQVVNVVHLDSTRMIRTLLGLQQVPRIGDFNGSDSQLSRRASKVIHDSGEHGIGCPSAIEPSATNFSFFETGYNTNVWAATLTAHCVRKALDERIALSVALRDLELQ